MQVVFNMTMDRARVSGVYWEEGGCLVGKVLMSDGSLVDDRREDCQHLAELARDLRGGQGTAYAAEVDDIRSALKYLGKAADLVQMLPKIDLWKDAPRQEMDDDSNAWKEKFRDV